VLDDGEIKYDGTSVKFLDEFSSQLIEIEYKNNDFIKNKSFKNGLEKYKYKIDGNKIVIYLNNQDSIDIRYFTNNVEVISYKKIQSNLEETYRKFRDNLTNREIEMINLIYANILKDIQIVKHKKWRIIIHFRSE